MRTHKRTIALAAVILCTGCSGGGGGGGDGGGGSSASAPRASPPGQSPRGQNDGAPTPPPANLLFWSGFEGISVGAARDCYAAGCWQDVQGTDSVSGFIWPPRIAGGASQYQVRSGVASTPSDISDYIVNDIQTVTGRTG